MASWSPAGFELLKTSRLRIFWWLACSLGISLDGGSSWSQASFELLDGELEPSWVRAAESEPALRIFWWLTCLLGIGLDGESPWSQAGFDLALSYLRQAGSSHPLGGGALGIRLDGELEPSWLRAAEGEPALRIFLWLACSLGILDGEPPWSQAGFELLKASCLSASSAGC